MKVFRSSFIVRRQLLFPVSTIILSYGIDPATACALGYRKAAQIIVQNIRSRGEETVLFYPVVFLYRHCFELALKNLIVKFEQPNLRSITGIPALTEAEGASLTRGKKAHSLQWLWDLLRPRMERLSGAVEAAKVAGINSYVRQLSSIDPDSTPFRYGSDETRDRIFDAYKKGTDVDLIGFARAMEWLAGYLDGVEAYLDSFIEIQDDSDADENQSYY